MRVKKVMTGLFSPALTGVLFVVMVVALAIATFIENDYGAAAARFMVYNSWWFAVIMLLAVVNMSGQIVRYRLYKRKKLSVFLFHAAFIIIIAGAAVTHYYGFEGMLHIREGETKSMILSSDNYITVDIKDATNKTIAESSDRFEITPVSVDDFEREYDVDGSDWQLRLDRFLPNVTETVEDSPGGSPVISIMVAHGVANREVLIIGQGETRLSMGLSLTFDGDKDADIVLVKEDDGIFFMVADTFSVTDMTTRQTTIYNAGSRVAADAMKIYNIGEYRVIPQRISMEGVIRPFPLDPAREKTGINALEFVLTTNDGERRIWLWDRDDEIKSASTQDVDGAEVKLTYGPGEVNIPFSIRLNEFVLERYPGSISPSGYKSYVMVIDEEGGIRESHDIYMNNILKYKGYRFYQASYDTDEKGTILAVNRDIAGMIITYTGYALLILSMVITLFNRAAYLYRISPLCWRSALRRTMVVLIIIISATTVVNGQKMVVDRSVADEFGKILVQDNKGRTKPLAVMSNDILRKVARADKVMGYNSVQVFLGLCFDFDNWKNVPVINVSGGVFQNITGLKDDYVSFSDLVVLSPQPFYLLNDRVTDAYSKPPGARNRTDKEVLKIDERVNISYMITTGDFLRIFPLRDGSTSWGTAEEALAYAPAREDSLFLNAVLHLFVDAVVDGNTEDAIDITKAIREYQKTYAGYELPSSGKINTEILYYKLKIFQRLAPLYAVLGLILITVLVYLVVAGKKRAAAVTVTVRGGLLMAFIVHTAGLIMRWYISGHSPMSNGYESLLFISWVTILAGLILSRKSWFTLSLTALLAALTLLVAHMSFMDPEITALVPVLQSYWLILHVSVITASYAFFGLSAMLGLLSLVMMLLVNDNNRIRISNAADELIVVNYQSLTLGLFLLVTGTFLGAIWANESWGRYWGWDPKETWSLITIIVYSFVIHSRMIPGMRDLFTFNVMTIIAFASVLMTYFGVNYYLSGLHSYAGGDPVELPAALYITIALILLLAVMAYRRYVSLNREMRNE